MTVRKPTFRVELADGSEHVVEVVHADQLRAELEAPRHMIPVNPGQLPLATTTLWLWAACSRLGITTAKFQAFKGELVAVNRVDDDVAPDQPVDPTQPDRDTPGP